MLYVSTRCEGEMTTIQPSHGLCLEKSPSFCRRNSGSQNRHRFLKELPVKLILSCAVNRGRWVQKSAGHQGCEGACAVVGKWWSLKKTSEGSHIRIRGSPISYLMSELPLLVAGHLLEPGRFGRRTHSSTTHFGCLFLPFTIIHPSIRNLDSRKNPLLASSAAQ